MNMKRRIFGLLLAICIAGGLLPVSTMPVAAATGHTVTIGGKEFITDSNGIMAYRYNNDAYDDYTFDIYGKFGGEWKQTTYDSSGYYTYIKIADSSKFVQAVSSVDNGYTISDTGLNVGIDFAFTNSGKTLQICYTVANTSNETVTFSLGTGSDVQIGADDAAGISLFDNHGGFKMVSAKSSDQSSNGEYAQFNFFGRGYEGVTAVDNFWYGPYSSDDNFYWGGNKESAVFYTDDQRVPYERMDSACSWNWIDETIEAEGSKTYSVLIGIGGAESENAAQSSGISSSNGEISLELTSPVSGPDAFKVYVDGTDAENALTNGTDYTIENPTSNNPVIKFTDTAGLTCKSVIKVKIDGINELVEIANNIPCSYIYTANGTVITGECVCGKETVVSVFAPTSVIYDGTEKNAVLNTDNWTLKNEVPSIQYGETDDRTNVTDKPITASVTVGADNNVATASVTYTILPADLSEVTVKQTGTLTANGSAQTPTVSADAVSVNSQPVTFTYSKEEKGTYGADVPAFTEAGDHTVYSKASAPNHKDTTGSFTVTIGEQKSNETVVPTEPTEPTAPSEPDDTSKPSEPSKPDDNKDNPQTGDSSNLALWFVLLFAAAGGLTATTIVIRKRKAE